MKNLFKQAHKLTREMVKEYKDVDYQVQFGLYLQFLLEEESTTTIKSQEDLTEAVEELIKEISGHESGRLNITVNEWQNYGKHRIYLEGQMIVLGNNRSFKGYIHLPVDKTDKPVKYYHEERIGSHVTNEINKAIHTLIDDNIDNIIKFAA